jgi:hypothetical protein
LNLIAIVLPEACCDLSVFLISVASLKASASQLISVGVRDNESTFLNAKTFQRALGLIVITV